MELKENYILWLPSWYPNQLDAYTGDFIQRHALATSAFVPITVMHVVQSGPELYVPHSREQIYKNLHFEEHMLLPSFRPTGIKWLDRVRYNLRYHRYARKYLMQYFKENGLPLGLHVHVPMKAGLLALWVYKRWGIPFIVSEQSSHYIPGSSDAYYSKSKAHKLQVQRIFQKAAVVTNVSQCVGNMLKELFNRKEVFVIHNTVDTSLFYHSEKQNGRQEVFTFFHASMLNEQKNIKGILRAFASLLQRTKNWQLVLAGPFDISLVDFIQQLGLTGQVQLRGMIPYEQVAKEMQAANAFVLFSRHENFPCVVIEALCCGLPVVAGDVAGVKEAVNATNGILVAPHDEAALASALYQIIETYQNYDRKEIARNSGRLYSFKAIGAQIFNLYQTNFGIRR